MNFQEWFDNSPEVGEQTCIECAAEMGWKACKEKILKILKSKEDFFGDTIHTPYQLSTILIKEIEQL